MFGSPHCIEFGLILSERFGDFFNLSQQTKMSKNINGSSPVPVIGSRR